MKRQGYVTCPDCGEGQEHAPGCVTRSGSDPTTPQPAATHEWGIDPEVIRTDLTDFNVVISDEEGRVVCLVPGRTEQDTRMVVNARLTAAAPTLLEALKDVVADWNDRHLLTEVALRRHFDRAEAALALATPDKE